MSNLVKYLLVVPLLALAQLVDSMLHWLLAATTRSFGATKPQEPARHAVVSRQVDERDPSSPYRPVFGGSVFDDMSTKAATSAETSRAPITAPSSSANIFDEFAAAAAKYAECSTFGTREVYRRRRTSKDNTAAAATTLQMNGSARESEGNAAADQGLEGDEFEYVPGEYVWTTYARLLERVVDVSNGLLKLGLHGGAGGNESSVVLFAETCADWLVSALACFRVRGLHVVTLYATLGVDALVHAVNETHSSHLVVSSDDSTLGKVRAVLHRLRSVTHLIVLIGQNEANNGGADVAQMRRTVGPLARLSVYTLEEVAEIGHTSRLVGHTRPNAHDLAIVMYTSGSTAEPKGVMITHANILCMVRALQQRMTHVSGVRDSIKGMYVAYLPVAHILELVAELCFLLVGTPIGFSSPRTLFQRPSSGSSSSSSGTEAPVSSDICLLQPTVMVCVPVLLERLRKRVLEMVAQRGATQCTFFEEAYERKLKRVRSEGATGSFLLDWLVFCRIWRRIVGARLRLIVSAGATLTPPVHEFSQVCLGVAIVQGYGLTETCGSGTLLYTNNTATQTCGSVVQCCQIRLVDSSDGSYRTSDKPNPRGEIWIGGPSVTLGYYKRPELTREHYHTVDGVRYFASGDIGEILPDGNLRLVDRMKDLVKLSSGEYLSLGKVESCLKLLAYVDNCCVIVDAQRPPYCVCLIAPDERNLDFEQLVLSSSNALRKKQPAQNQVEDVSEEQEVEQDKHNTKQKNDATRRTVDQFVNAILGDAHLLSAYTQDVRRHCSANGLAKFEIPARIRFVREPWLPETGLVTDSLKIKRTQVAAFYATQIETLWSVENS